MMQGKGVSTSQAKASFTSEPPFPCTLSSTQISTRLTDWSKNMVVEILSSKSLGGNHYKAITRFQRQSGILSVIAILRHSLLAGVVALQINWHSRGNLACTAVGWWIMTFANHLE